MENIKNQIKSSESNLGNTISEIRNNKLNSQNIEVEYLEDFDSNANSTQNKTYVVGRYGSGEKFTTLWAIAEDSGVSIEEIKKANPSIGADNVIHSGQEIVVPIKNKVMSNETVTEKKEEEPKEVQKENDTSTTTPKANNDRTAVSTINVPNNLNQTGIIPNYTNYEYFYGKWNKGTAQHELSELWASKGKTNDRGIATIDDNYLVAVSPKFGKAGDKVEVVLEDGTSINCIIADVKGGDAGNEWGHSFGRSGIDIIEWESLGKQDTIELGDWKGKDVAKIINYGSYLG